jgi:alcohol dehydrogenase
MLSTREFTIGTGSSAIFGSGAIGRLPEILTGLTVSRALLVTDQGVMATGIGDRIARMIEAAGLTISVFDRVRANPTTDDLETGAETVRAFAPSVVVAAGGGSVLDTAKALALMAVNDGPTRDFDYRNEPRVPGLPLIAVPTTAGTGSETNGYGVIEDIAAGRKFYVGHSSVVPRVALLDPELTCGLPAGPTAATGMDVLTHALESLSSRRSNAYADGLNLQAVQMVSRYLPRAEQEGQDLEARAQMLLAAHMAGLAFATTGLGLCHAVGHALSAHLGVAHGVALAVMLPHVLAFNLPVRAQAYAGAAWAMGVYDSHKDDEANAHATVEAVQRLVREVGMPQSLAGLGVTKTLIPALAEDALADEVVANTPRVPDRGELEAMLIAVL